MNTLDELLSKDVKELTLEDARVICKAIRERRAQWEISESKRKSEGKKQPSRKAGTTKESVVDLSIDEIMGD